jgi:hypothetical protein
MSPVEMFALGRVSTQGPCHSGPASLLYVATATRVRGVPFRHWSWKAASRFELSAGCLFVGGRPLRRKADTWLLPNDGPSLTDAVEKGLRLAPNSDSADSEDHSLGGGDDGAAEV